MTDKLPLLTRAEAERVMVLAGHAINANDGRCGLIEDALSATTDLCCQAIDLLSINADLLAAGEALVKMISAGGMDFDQYDQAIAAIARARGE